MQEPAEGKPERVVRIGPDQVTVRDDEVLIEARHPMPDWEVRDFAAIPVYFEDKKYILIQKRKSPPPYAVRYVLKPWPEGEQSARDRFHAYDAATVAGRDRDRRSEVFHETVRMCLLPFSPFLGLLWSRTQNRLTRFGLVPRSLTSISIFMVFCLAFAQGVFAVILVNTTLRTGKFMIGGALCALMKADHLQIGPLAVPVLYLDALLLAAFIADAAIRYSNYLREHEWIGGFFEWLVPRSLWKKKVQDKPAESAKASAPHPA